MRQVFTEEIKHYFDRLAPLLPDHDTQARGDQGTDPHLGMVGAVLLARAVDDPELSNRILDACREFYTTAFTSRADAERANDDQQHLPPIVGELPAQSSA